MDERSHISSHILLKLEAASFIPTGLFARASSTSTGFRLSGWSTYPASWRARVGGFPSC